MIATISGKGASEPLVGMPSGTKPATPVEGPGPDDPPWAWRLIFTMLGGGTTGVDPFDPLEITQALGRSPTESWRVGDRRVVRGRRMPRPAKTSGWELEVPDAVGIDLETRLRWLLDELQPRRELLAAVLPGHRAMIELIADVRADANHPLLTLTAGTLERLGRLGAIGVEFGLDIVY